MVLRNPERTPQGGRLSLLLANILLDDFDQELEQLGHQYARHGEDRYVYV